MHEPQDAEPFVPWLPFGRCAHCEGVVVTEGGLAGPHLTPCGAHCTLSPTPERGPTCSGWCSACRTARTGCAGNPDAPCGRLGCPECGVHYVFQDDGPSWPARSHARPSCRVAWTWDRVTCGECHRLRKVDAEASLAGPPSSPPAPRDALAPALTNLVQELIEAYHKHAAGAANLAEKRRGEGRAEEASRCAGRAAAFRDASAMLRARAAMLEHAQDRDARTGNGTAPPKEDR